MAGSNDFTGQNIQDTYQRVLQISSSGELADGTGSLVPLLDVTASFAISSSIEILKEVSSSNADTASYIQAANIEQPFTHITASNNISASGNIIGSFAEFQAYSIQGTTVLERQTNDIIFGGATDFTSITIGSQSDPNPIILKGNVTASNDISASGNIFMGNILHSNNEPIIGFVNNTVNIGNSIHPIKLFGHITASSHISASGTVQVSDSGYFIGTQVPPVLSLSGPRLRISSSNDIFYDSGDDHIFLSEGTEVVHIRGDEAIFEVTGDIDLNGNLDTSGHITASGNISGSGDLIGRRVVVGLADTLRLSEEGGTGNFVIDDNAGGNVNQFTIFADDFATEGNTVLGNTISDRTLIKGHVTASGEISSSDDIYAQGFYVEHGGSFHNASFLGTKINFNQGQQIFHVGTGQTNVEAFRITTSQGAWFNASNITAHDFRIDGSSDYLLFADAGLNKIGIKTSTPKAELHVEGDISASNEVRGVSGSFSKLTGHEAFTTGLEVNGFISANEITASIISSSGTITANTYVGLPSGILSGSIDLENNLVLPPGVISSSAQLPSGIYSSSLQTLGNITASGNISASGTVFADKIHLKSSTTPGPIVQLQAEGASGADNFIRFGDSTENYSYAVGADDSGNTFKIAYNGSAFDGAVLGTNDVLAIDTVGNITASGNISASGNIIADKFYADGALEKGFIAVDSSNTHLGVNTGWKVGTHITASGEISSSDKITAVQFNARTSGTGYKLSGTKALYTHDSSTVVGRTGRLTLTGSSARFGRPGHTMHVTASGHISSSATIFALSASIIGPVSASNIHIPDGGKITFDKHVGSLTNITTTGNPSDLEIHTAKHIKLMPDDDIQIMEGSTQYATFDGGQRSFEIEGPITASGNISSSATIIPKYRDYPFDSFSSGASCGDIITIGSGPAGNNGDIVAGRIYCMDSDQHWELVDANASATSIGMLGIAIENGTATFLIKGLFYHTNFSAGIATGNPLYISESPGVMTATAPTTAGAYVRIIGYMVDHGNRGIFFDPDKSWVELS